MGPLSAFRHLLLPHHANNHQARILDPAVISIFVAFFLVYQFFLNFYLLISPSILGFAADISPEKVIALSNQKRAENGLEPLQVNARLSEAAQRKAGDMFAFNYWAHASPLGRSPWAFFSEAGYRYLYAGENLARDFMNSESVVEAWMNSPTHRDNLLSPKYKEIGLAVVNGTLNGVETTLVVQLFGTPPPTVAKKPLSKTTTAPISTTAILSQANKIVSPPMISPFALTKAFAVFFLGLVLGALAMDIVLLYRKKLVRLSGKNVAHLIFIGFLLLTIILTTPGAIL